MRFFRMGFALVIFSLFSSVYASQCPSADDVRHCDGDRCTYKQFNGWSTNIFYMDKGKPFTFQKSSVKITDQGNQLNCYYTYLNTENHKKMPPALLLTTIVN